VPISATAQSLLALIPKANTTKGLFDDGTAISGPSHKSSRLQPLGAKSWCGLITTSRTITRLTFRYIHDAWQTEVPKPASGGVGGSNFQDIHTKFVGPGTSFVARLNANISPHAVE